MEFWDLTWRFFSLADANVRWVLAGSVLLGGAAGGLGAFAFLQQRSLLGDTIAHAALPGVGIAFLLIGEKQFVLLLLGAAATGWLGAMAINAIVRHTKIHLDSALGIVLTVFFGLGVVLLTYIQKTGAGAQSGLDNFLFGQAAAMTRSDVTALAVVGIALLVIMAVGFHRFKLITFDPDFGRAIGMRTGWLQFLLTTMIVAAVTIGLQAVGVVLMAAMLVTPAASARQWTDNLGRMIVLASMFGMLAGVLGAWISFLAPRLPTGPWMVVAISVIFFVSVMFAPNRGVVARLRRHYGNRSKMNEDHILKVLFREGQKSNDWSGFFPADEIQRMWSFTGHELRRALRRLDRRGFLEKAGEMYRLTNPGRDAGARILRRHRLWEVYLAKYLELPHDHLHRDAEDMEHILTPAMEERLEEILEHPEQDPHAQEIPYHDREVSS